MKEYRLWFGRYKGKTVEQLMFFPAGYRYLLWLRRNYNPTSTLSHRVKEILIKGEKPKVKTKCQCGNPVKWISYSGNYTGYITGEYLCCDQCKFRGMDFLPVKFSSFQNFFLKHDQKMFLRILKFCLFGNEKTIITKKDAFLFFSDQPDLFGA